MSQVPATVRHMTTSTPAPAASNPATDEPLPAATSGQLVLGVDLDGCVGDYETAFRRCVAAQLGVAEDELGPQHSYDPAANGWGIRDHAHFLDLHCRAVAEQRLFADMPVVPGAAEALWTLSDAGVRIRIVTHRLCVNGIHHTAVADTVAWLDAHDLPYRDLCFVEDKAQVGADVFVDDAPHNVASLRAAGVDVITFDQRYNRELPGPRARTWADVTRHVLHRLVTR
jgi:5'(3')-deoxyribonucleotidase